jgi:hypothetical protein
MICGSLVSIPPVVDAPVVSEVSANAVPVHVEKSLRVSFRVSTFFVVFVPPANPAYTLDIAADAIAIAAEGEIPRFVDTASPADFAIALRANSSAESKIVDEIVG